MRAVLAMMKHETNTFSPVPTPIERFARATPLPPTDDDGEVIGGRYLLVGSAEYEHYFNDRWGIALFYDIGNAYDDIVDELGDELERGAGFGLRWKSPIGPVRVDLANAITDDDRPWRLHINIGPDL